jgi:hypothetical protein
MNQFLILLHIQSSNQADLCAQRLYIYIRFIIGLLFAAFLMSGLLSCTSSDTGKKPFTYTVEAGIACTEPVCQELPAQLLHKIVVVKHPVSTSERFIEDQVILKAKDNEELSDFLDSYHGKILKDGRLPLPPKGYNYDITSPPAQSSNYYLIQVDLDTADIANFVKNMQDLGFYGHYRFSSQSAVKLFAIVAKEKLKGRILQNNSLLDLRSSDCVIHKSEEYKVDASAPNPKLFNNGYADGFDFTWLNDDKFEITRAWQYLDVLGKSKKIVPMGIIDRGFVVNPDFRGHPQMWGYDFISGDYDVTAVKENGNGNYHGTKSFSTAAALINNRFGSAGTGGQVVVPLFYRVLDVYDEASAIKTAVNWQVDVINISLGNYSGLADVERDALKYAYNHKVVVVSAAGNSDLDNANIDNYPCEGDAVICVGALERASKKAFNKATHGWGSNYGVNVDIWAYGDVAATATPTPKSKPKLSTFGRTSQASPYVAGIVAMMKAIDPSLTPDKTLSVLQSTANKSTDKRVKSGYVNAYKAVSKTASLAGVSVKGDKYENNNTIASAYSIMTTNSYTATVEPNDTDYYKVILPDYTPLSVTYQYQRAGNFNDIRLDITDLAHNLQKTYDVPLGIGSPTKLKTTTDGSIRDLYLSFFGEKTKTINCYKFETSTSKPIKIKPDRFDDQIYPNGKYGEPRNDIFEDRAKITKPLNDTVLIPDSIDKLNFDKKGDKDYFEIILPPEKDPKTNATECLAPGKKPYGEIGFTQGQLKIDVHIDKKGVSEPFKITLYDAKGNSNNKGITKQSGLNLVLECPHKYFPKGHMYFSVESAQNRRNFYSLYLKYKRWDQLLDIPIWIYTLPYPPLARIPWPIPDRPFIQRYPASAEIINDVFRGKLSGPLPKEYIILQWKETGELNINMTTVGNRYLEMTLYDIEQQEIARTSYGYTAKPAKTDENQNAGRIYIPQLAAGTYILGIGPGHFGSTYLIQFGRENSSTANIQ